MSIRNIINHKIGFAAFFTAILAVITFLSGFILSNPRASAGSFAVVDIAVDIPVSCSIVASRESISTTIVPGNSGEIGDTTIKAVCNDPAGLAVYAAGFTNDTYTNNNLSTTVGGTTINIPTAIASSPSTSQWNMIIEGGTGTYAPTIVQEFDNANHIIPAQYTKVAYRNTTTDVGASATGAQFTATFNAYIANDQAAGTYTGKVKFLLIHPNVLTYNDQTGEPATFQPATLARDPEDILYLQDVADWGDSIALGETIEAVDRRDNQTYTVKRLKMNAAGTQSALWMSNLNLGAEILTVTQLDDTNTNLASGVSSIAKNTFEGWIHSEDDYVDWSSDPAIILLTASNSSNGRIVDEYGNKYGAIYNYPAASAGIYTWGSITGPSSLTSDLCPSGWHLPTADSSDNDYGYSGDFVSLVDAYDLYDMSNYQWNTGGFTSMQQDLGFSLAGIGGGGYYAQRQGVGGHYLSSYIDDSSVGIVMEFDEDYGLSLGWGWVYEFGTGASIRCVAQ